MTRPMTRTTGTSTALAVVIATLLTAPAALGASAADPDDVTGGIDIARSAVRTVEPSPGEFRMRLKVLTYDLLDLSDGVGSIYWQLDTRGAGAPDYEVYVFGDPEAVPAAPAFCLFRALGTEIREYVQVSVSGTTAVCGFPRHFVKTTKPIRWRVAGRSAGVIDRAPDIGWNGG